MPGTNCPACESGECLEHGVSLPPSLPDGGPGPSTPPAPTLDETAVTRAELEGFKKKVAKSVRRLNRAVKEARQERREPETGVEPPPEPPPAPERRMNDAAKLGLGVFRACKRK